MTKGKFFLLLVIAFVVLFAAAVNIFGFGGIIAGGTAVGIFLILIGRKNTV